MVLAMLVIVALGVGVCHLHEKRKERKLRKLAAREGDQEQSGFHERRRHTKRRHRCRKQAGSSAKPEYQVHSGGCYYKKNQQQSPQSQDGCQPRQFEQGSVTHGVRTVATGTTNEEPKGGSAFPTTEKPAKDAFDAPPAYVL